MEHDQIRCDARPELCSGQEDLRGHEQQTARPKRDHTTSWMASYPINSQSDARSQRGTLPSPDVRKIGVFISHTAQGET